MLFCSIRCGTLFYSVHGPTSRYLRDSGGTPSWPPRLTVSQKSEEVRDEASDHDEVVVLVMLQEDRLA